MGNLSSSSYFAYGTTATATDITAATTTTIDATTTNQNEQQQTTTSVMTTINGTGGTETTATTQLDAGAADQQAQQLMTTTTDGATTVTVTTTNGMTGTTTTTQLDAGADQQQSPPQLKMDDISLPSPPPQAAIATDEVAPPPPSLSSWLFLSTTTAPLPPPPSPPKETTTPIVGNVLPLLANGKYEVGCADIMISDPFSYSAAVSSPCAASCAEGDKQQRPVGVFARIFYPASPSSSSSASSLNGSSAPSSSTTAPAPSPKQFMRWRPDTEYTQGLANYQGMSVAKINIFLDWFVGDKKTPVRWHAPIFPGEQRFPLIIFSHGISGNRFVYTTVCASLASHGYVVAALEHRDGSCCWTYTLEPVPQPMPLPTPSSATEEQKLQNGGANSAKPPQQQPTIPPRTMTPPPTHVKKPIEMRILPHDETEYETRIGQVKKRVDETVQMRRLFVEMDQNGLKDEGENGTFDGQQQHHRIVDGQTFDWSQFKCRFALDRCVCMGHSFGAASALTACAEHPSMFHACVLLDAWLYPVERRMFPTIGQPVLMLNASKWQWARNVRRMHRLLATTASLTDTTKANDGGATATTAPAQDGVGNNTKATTTTTNASAAFTNTDTRMMFTIKDIVHQSFSDFGFLVPGRVARYLAIQGDLDPMLTGTAIMEMMLDFLELQFQQQQKRREERGEEQQQDDDDKDEEEKEEKGTEEREGDEQRQRKDNNGEEAKDMVKSNASSALDHLRRLVADKYATFVLEGTDIPKEKLDEVASFVEAEHLELVLEEERKVANDSAIDTPTTEEKNETQTEKEEEQTEKEEEQMEEEEEQGM